MKYKKKSHKVSIVMGSQSDYKTMKNCEKVLKILKVNYETNIVSAHRTPDRLYTYAKKAENNNISIIIAGCLLYTSPSPRDPIGSRMPSSA